MTTPKNASSSSMVSGCMAPAGDLDRTFRGGQAVGQLRQSRRACPTPSPRPVRTPSARQARASPRSSTCAKIVATPAPKPIVIGHSFGGLIAEHLLGQDPGHRGDRDDPRRLTRRVVLRAARLRAASLSWAEPANGKVGFSLTPAQLRYAFGDALSEQIGTAVDNEHPRARTHCRAAFANFAPHSPARWTQRILPAGPLLLISASSITVPNSSRSGPSIGTAAQTAVTNLRRLATTRHFSLLTAAGGSRRHRAELAECPQAIGRHERRW